MSESKGINYETEVEASETKSPRIAQVPAGTLPPWEKARQEMLASADQEHEDFLDANGLRLDDASKQQRKNLAELFATRKGDSTKKKARR